MRTERRLPTVVFLFSSSLNPRCSGIGHWLLYHTLVHDYGDLEKAIAYLRTHEWIPLVIAVIAEVGGIVHDRASGVTLTDQQGSPLISYPDVAQAMVLMEEDDKWIGKAVGMVVNEGRPIEANGAALLRYLLPNLLATLCPPLWRLGRNYWA